MRITRDADGNIVLRDDQDQANYQMTGNDRTHVVKANFVWDMPDLQRNGRSTVVGAVVNDWQLSGIFTGGSGAPYTVGYSYQGERRQNLTGSPNYAARVVITGDPGNGCSSDSHGSSTPRPSAGRSRAAWVSSPAATTWSAVRTRPDLAIARNIKLGRHASSSSGRDVQRVQLGDHHGPQLDDEHCEPGHGVKRRPTCRMTPPGT